MSGNALCRACGMFVHAGRVSPQGQCFCNALASLQRNQTGSKYDVNLLCRALRGRSGGAAGPGHGRGLQRATGGRERHPRRQAAGARGAAHWDAVLHESCHGGGSTRPQLSGHHDRPSWCHEPGTTYGSSAHGDTHSPCDIITADRMSGTGAGRCVIRFYSSAVSCRVIASQGWTSAGAPPGEVARGVPPRRSLGSRPAAGGAATTTRLRGVAARAGAGQNYLDVDVITRRAKRGQANSWGYQLEPSHIGAGHSTYPFTATVIVRIPTRAALYGVLPRKACAFGTSCQQVRKHCKSDVAQRHHSSFMLVSAALRILRPAQCSDADDMRCHQLTPR